MNKLIIQIGRLDSYYRKKIPIKHEDKVKEYELTSHFYKKEVLNNQAQLLLLFPVSLPIQKFNSSTDDPFIQKCIDAISSIEKFNDFLSHPENLFQNHPHLSEDDFLVLPSLGNYIAPFGEIHLNTNLEAITLRILFYLLKKYVDVEEIHLDISSGQNIYNIALINAIYRFIPIHEFYHGKNKKLNVKIIYSDPIIPNNNHPIKLHFTNFKAKAFFSLPELDLNFVDISIKKIYNNRNEEENNTKKLLKDIFQINIPLIFLSVKYSLLLILFEQKLYDKEILEKLSDFFHKYSDYILNLTHPKSSTGNHSEIESINKLTKQFHSITNIIFYYAIFKGLAENLNKIPAFSSPLKAEITKTNEKEPDINLINLDDIENILFSKYDSVAEFKKFKSELNRLFNDEILETLFKLSKSDYIDYSELLKNTSSYDLNTNFNPRNFAAHCGLEKNSIQLKLVDSIRTNISYTLEIRLNPKITQTYKKILSYFLN